MSTLVQIELYLLQAVLHYDGNGDKRRTEQCWFLFNKSVRFYLISCIELSEKQIYFLVCDTNQSSEISIPSDFYSFNSVFHFYRRHSDRSVFLHMLAH